MIFVVIIYTYNHTVNNRETTMTTAQDNTQIFSDTEQMDTAMYEKLGQLFQYLSRADLEEMLFIRLHSRLNEALQRVVGISILSDDGVFPLFTQMTDKKWSTVENLMAFERSAFAVDFLATVFVIGELGRNAKGAVQYKDDPKLVKKLFLSCVMKVGKHIIAATQNSIHGKDPVADINANHVKEILNTEIKTMPIIEAYPALEAVFQTEARYTVPLVHIGQEMVLDLIGGLKTAAA